MDVIPESPEAEVTSEKRLFQDLLSKKALVEGVLFDSDVERVSQVLVERKLHGVWQEIAQEIIYEGEEFDDARQPLKRMETPGRVENDLEQVGRLVGRVAERVALLHPSDNAKGIMQQVRRIREKLGGSADTGLFTSAMKILGEFADPEREWFRDRELGEFARPDSSYAVLSVPLETSGMTLEQTGIRVAKAAAGYYTAAREKFVHEYQDNYGGDIREARKALFNKNPRNVFGVRGRLTVEEKLEAYSNPDLVLGKKGEPELERNLVVVVKGNKIVYQGQAEGEFPDKLDGSRDGQIVQVVPGDTRWQDLKGRICSLVMLSDEADLPTSDEWVEAKQLAPDIPFIFHVSPGGNVARVGSHVFSAGEQTSVEVESVLRRAGFEPKERGQMQKTEKAKVPDYLPGMYFTPVEIEVDRDLKEINEAREKALSQFFEEKKPQIEAKFEQFLRDNEEVFGVLYTPTQRVLEEIGVEPGKTDSFKGLAAGLMECYLYATKMKLGGNISVNGDMATLLPMVVKEGLVDEENRSSIKSELMGSAAAAVFLPEEQRHRKLVIEPMPADAEWARMVRKAADEIEEGKPLEQTHRMRLITRRHMSRVSSWFGGAITSEGIVDQLAKLTPRKMEELLRIVGEKVKLGKTALGTITDYTSYATLLRKEGSMKYLKSSLPPAGDKRTRLVVSGMYTREGQVTAQMGGKRDYLRQITARRIDQGQVGELSEHFGGLTKAREFRRARKELSKRGMWNVRDDGVLNQLVALKESTKGKEQEKLIGLVSRCFRKLERKASKEKEGGREIGGLLGQLYSEQLEGMADRLKHLYRTYLIMRIPE